jgi:Arc/MetJ family transcription regulator
MRTNIHIDDALMSKAMTLSGYKTKWETVEAALGLLVRLKSQEAIRAARGKLRWEGNLDAMRGDQ